MQPINIKYHLQLNYLKHIKQIKMKNLTLIICILFITKISFAQNKNEKPFLEKSFLASDIKNLEIKTSGGGITVEGTDNKNAKVEVYIRSSNWNGTNIDREEIESRLNDYILTVGLIGNKLECISKNKSNNMNWKKGLSITFKVFVPKNIDTQLNTSGGGISLNDLKGDLNFSTSGGGLNIRNLSGNVKGRTSGGGISMTDCHDNVNLTTSGGGITAKYSNGNIYLRTSGGGLTLENLKGKIDASTSGGGINAKTISGTLITSTSGGSISLDDVGGNIKASTSGGGIHANISTIGEYLSLDASSGNIKVDMPLSKGMDLDIRGQRVTHASLNNFDGEVDKDQITGKLNGGGAKVRIHAGSGNVSLN
jgi:Putative adhesin